MAERQKLVHLHSSSVKIPTAEQLNYGEIAVQYASAEPCFYIKDSGDNIIKFIDASGVDAKIQAALSSITQTVSTLVGEDTNKSIRTISAEEVAKIVASADTSYDTLKEIADWILNDSTGAAKMANDINQLLQISADTRISALETASGSNHTHTNKAILDEIDSTDITSWDAAAAASHSHSNMSVLTGITSEKVAAWDEAAESAHTHSNIEVLTGITSEKVAAWDEATASAHTHDNMSVLTGITSQKVSDWDEAAASAHTHDNMSVLTGITSQKVSDWDEAAASAHTHDNMGVLSGITSQNVANWDSAYTTSLSAVTGIAVGKEKGVTISNHELDFSGIEIDCGTY